MGTSKDNRDAPGPDTDEPPCFGPGDHDRSAATPSWAIPGVAANDRGYRAADDEWLRKSAPILADFLTVDGLAGKQRKTGTLLIFCEEGRWKCCLNDRDGGHVTFSSGKTWLDMLKSLDKGLKAGTLDWRASKGRR